MAAQSGKDVLVKLDQTGSGSFLTVAGLRTRALALNAAAVDITDSESAGRWRELLDGGGIKRAAVSGSGIFKDQTSDAAVRELFFGGTIRNWQLILPDFGVIEGACGATHSTIRAMAETARRWRRTRRSAPATALRRRSSWPRPTARASIPMCGRSPNPWPGR